MKVPSALRTSSPWAGPSTNVAVSESPSMSVSLVRTFPARGVSSLVVNESPAATGVSLTAVTVIATVATVVVAVPSVAV